MMCEEKQQEALKNLVKLRETSFFHTSTTTTTLTSSPGADRIRHRQEIKTRREHNKDWIRRWQDDSCKFRVLNLNNFLNIKRDDEKKLSTEDERENCQLSNTTQDDEKSLTFSICNLKE